MAGPYEKWNQSGIGVAGAHWIHVDGNPDPTAQVSSMPFGRPTPDYYEGLHRSTEITTPAKLIWYGDGGCGSPTTWADDSWWIKNTDTSGGGSEDKAGFNRLQQDQYGCQRHEGKANYAFADGHVQLLNANEIRCDNARVLVVGQSCVSPDAAAMKQPSQNLPHHRERCRADCSGGCLRRCKVGHFRSDGEAGARVWFYDQSAKQLYPAPRDLIPPDGNNDNRVRAMVIGFQGMGNEISQLQNCLPGEIQSRIQGAAGAGGRRPTPPNGRSRRRFPRRTAPTFKTTPWSNAPAKLPGTPPAPRRHARSWPNGATGAAAGQPPIISVPSIQ